MTKRRDGLRKMKSIAENKMDKTEFDRIYIENADLFIEFANDAIDTLKKSEYDDVVKDTLYEKSFCHHDFTYHNIVFSENNDISIIDFDYCKYEIRTYDITSFLIKVLKRNSWDFNLAKQLIEAYDSVSPIKENEYMIMMAFLKFPQRFWRLANRFYYNEANWSQSTFLRKIKEIAGEKDEFIDFIGEFEENYDL